MIMNYTSWHFQRSTPRVAATTLAERKPVSCGSYRESVYPGNIAHSLVWRQEGVIIFEGCVRLAQRNPLLSAVLMWRHNDRHFALFAQHQCNPF